MLFASIRFWLAARKKLGPIQASEPLARFLTSSSHFSPGRVRQAAFLPPADLKLSVFRTSEMEEADIWTLGHNHVERPSGRHLHGRAQLTPAAVRGCGLEVDPDDQPRRHANLVGWPPEKAERKQIALQLAAAAKVILSV